MGEGVPQSDVLAVELYRKAADQGNAAAQCSLGIMYFDGKGGLPHSEAAALELWREAAEQVSK